MYMQYTVYNIARQNSKQIHAYSNVTDLQLLLFSIPFAVFCLELLHMGPAKSNINAALVQYIVDKDTHSKCTLKAAREFIA